MRRLITAGAAFLLFVIPVSAANAQNYELRGSVREWVKNYSHEPQDRGLLESRIKLELISTLGYQSAFRVKSYYVYDGLSKKGTWDFQEAYIDLYYDWADFRFGKQVVAWGKADELNPTDVLNPQNLGNITEEKNIRKIGLLMLKSNFYVGGNTVSLIWKPEFDYYRFPVDNPRISIIPSFGTGGAPDPQLPENELDQTEWAVKISRTIGYYDFSVSYFDGWDAIFTPIFTLNLLNDPPLTVDRFVFHRTKMYGFDYAGSIRSFGFWGESAYFLTEDSDGVDPYVKNPYIQAVLGTDYTFANGVKINIQAYQEFLTKINNNLEEEQEKGIISRLGLGLPLQQAVSSRISKKFGASEQHSVELFGIFDTEESGYILQPKINFSPEDALVFEFGFALYGGKTNSLFGRFGQNDEISLKATYSF
ncbi:hypothetical protein ACFL6I_01845 [candidate division KSB1 bacterium]